MKKRFGSASLKIEISYEVLQSRQKEGRIIRNDRRSNKMIGNDSFYLVNRTNIESLSDKNAEC